MCDLIRPELAPDGRWMAIGSAQSWTITNDLNRARDIFIAYTESNRVEVASPEEPLRAAMTGTGMTSVTPEAASVNGEAIAAASLDNVYSPRDTNGVQELFLSYWRAGTSQSIINHRAGSIGQWDQWLGSAALSPNGRYLAYTASQLGLGFFGPLHENIFWLDLATGLSRQVNSCFSQWEVGKTQPKIHPNGTMVVFQGLAPNPCSALSRLLFYQASHVYLWSNRAQPGQEIQLVSLARDRSTSGNTDSLNPLFSPDGQWIVFQSLSTNLALQPVSGLRHQLLARRWAAGSTHLVSYNASFQGLDHTALGPSFSSDSRYLAFYTEPELKSYRHALPDTRGWKEFYPDGTNNWLLIPSNPDPVLQPNLELCSACSHPTLNHDGSLAAFLSHGESAQPDQIYVKDLETGGATLISTDATGAGAANGNCADAQISFDGRFVLFTSLADNLVEGDANRARDVFVRDRWLGLTVLLSRSVDGNRSANLASFHPFFSADGRTVVFQSFADDLVHGDYNLVRDVFVVRLGGEDSDGDGLEDDWETAYFGDLSRDGTLDYDADGHADGDDSKRAPTPSTMHPSYPC